MFSDLPNAADARQAISGSIERIITEGIVEAIKRGESNWSETLTDVDESALVRAREALHEKGYSVVGSYRDGYYISVSW